MFVVWRSGRRTSVAPVSVVTALFAFVLCVWQKVDDRSRLEVTTWLSLIETTAPLCLKRSRRRGSPAPMASPRRLSAVPVVYASCWRDSTSPWWERSPSARWCLPPTPPSSSDPFCCWWPSLSLGPAACAAAYPLPTARGGQRWAAGERGWWDTAGCPAGRRSRSRPASTRCRTPRPCSWAPRPRLGPRGPPARKWILLTCQDRASFSPWRPTVPRACLPPQRTQPRPPQTGRWGSTCHVREPPPSRPETLSSPV